MESRCKNCKKPLLDSRHTHCSDKCMFANLWSSESISGIPLETWDESETPWT